MKDVTTIGLDLAKQVFQVHGADPEGVPLFNRKLRRAEVLRFFERQPPCRVGIEACASAHHWARAIAGLGHEVRLLPPQYVKPFVKRGKTDAADAEAIAEAVTRKTMRFVPVKSAEQQAAAMILKTRALLVRQRTQAINALRAHMGELGIIAPTGIANVKALAVIVRDENDARLPCAARFALGELVDQIEGLAGRIDTLEREIVVLARRDDDMRRLATIPGVGAIIAMAVKAFVPRSRRLQVGPALCSLDRIDPESAFQRRQGAAWPNIENGQSGAAIITDDGSSISPASHTPSRPWIAVAKGNAGAAPVQGGRSCARQQDRPNDLGAAEQRGRIP